MNETQRLIITANGQTHEFCVKMHKVLTQDEFQLDPEIFYKKNTGNIPETPHYEIEIISPEEDFFKRNTLNFHKSEVNEKPFVCYPVRLGSIEEAKQLFLVWAMGSALKASGGKHLNEVYGEAGKDMYVAEKLLREKYGVVATSL